MKIIIVNEQDEVVGYKERDKTNPSTDIYRISALWLTNSKGQVLLAQRNLAKKHSPGKWGPAAAGTVEEGETYESNMYKEAKEEIGLGEEKFTLGPKMLRSHANKFFIQWFFCTADRDISDFKIQKEEVAGIQWVDKEFLVKDIETNSNKYTSGAYTWKQFLNP